MPDQRISISFATPTDLAAVRAFVRGRGTALGLPQDRADLLVLAVSELTTNTLQHTHDGGRVRVWADAEHVVCEVVDRGAARTFGRVMPSAAEVRGRGLAIVERVCDDVSTKSGPDGTVVLVRLRR